jgi:hypothetical protein
MVRLQVSHGKPVADVTRPSMLLLIDSGFLDLAARTTQ